MICMNYDHNKKFGLLKFHSGYGNVYLNSPKGYSKKIINPQTGQRQKTDNISDRDNIKIWDRGFKSAKC